MQPMLGKIEDAMVRLEERRQKMLDYLNLKVSEQDFHGVADAAMDLRDIDSELLAWKQILANLDS